MTHSLSNSSSSRCVLPDFEPDVAPFRPSILSRKVIVRRASNDVMERFIVTFDTFHLVTYLIVIVSILGIFLTGYGKSNG